MKFLKLFLIATVLVTSMSCNKEEIDLIVGTWELTKVEYTEEEHFSLLFIGGTAYYTGTGFDYNQRLVIEDFERYYTVGDFQIHLVRGNGNECDKLGQNFIESGSWSCKKKGYYMRNTKTETTINSIALNGDILTIDFSFFSGEVAIIANDYNRIEGTYTYTRM